MAKETAIDLANKLRAFKYDIILTFLVFRFDFTLTEHLYVTYLLNYGDKGKYKSLYNNTLK